MTTPPPPAASPIRGPIASFHWHSYASLPGRPVESIEDLDHLLELPEASGRHVSFFSHLYLLGMRTPGGPGVIPLSVSTIAKTAHRSMRWVYKALTFLSYYGYLYSVPAPAADKGQPATAGGQPELQRVVCLRIPAPGWRPVTVGKPPQGGNGA